MPTTLYEYYQSKGQAMPPLEERAKQYEQLGLGTASDYIAKNKSGDPTPNTQLLGKLTSGGIAGTATKSATQPTQPVVNTPAVGQQTATPAAPAAPAAPTGGAFDLNSSVFGKAMNEIRAKLTDNNDLTEQKRKLLQQLYDRPLTPEEVKALSPAQQTAIMSNNRQRIETEIRLVNDAISGRKDTLDSSVNYITGLYKDEQARIDTQRKSAEDTILKFINAYGKNAGLAIRAMYGEERLEQLKGLGFDIDAMAEALGTIAPEGDVQTQVVDINGAKVLINAKTGETIKNLGGGVPGPGNLPIGTSGNMQALYTIAQEQASFITSKFQQDSFNATVNRYMKAGDEKALANYLRLTAANNIPGADLKAKYLANVQILENLNALDEIMAKLEAEGVDTNLFTGSAQEIKNKVGLLGEPGLVDLAQQALNIRDLLARMRTGAAMTEQEIALYKKMTPGIFYTAALNRQLVQNLRNSLESTTDAYLGLSLPKGSLQTVDRTIEGTAERPPLSSFIR